MNDYTYVDNNLVKLQVFFKELFYKDLVESPSYPVSLTAEKNSQYCIGPICFIIHLLYIVLHMTYKRIAVPAQNADTSRTSAKSRNS